ncbi:MAG TPA: carboxypeptidase-like regulatory domain-containing protein [Bacteroidia bacterium]|jgi:hypothetical protein|nr:carboxypeptidase-like regulatory domain-containing protein [Bacteroidia bacterium]
MKKSNTINISVDEPCNQNWDAMKLTGNGRRCDSCNKTVVDFSKFTDKELIDFLQKAKGEICGRLNEYQLERPIYLPTTNNNSYLSKALLGTTLIAGIAATANGQTFHKNIAPAAVPAPLPTVMTYPNESAAATTSKQTEKDSSKRLVHGIITDARTKEPLVDAYVEVIGSGIYVQTNSDGKYELYIPDSMCNKEIQIEFYRWQHKTIEKTVESGKHAININIAMEYKEEHMKMGKMQVSR